jgi:SAM-dependent methyltransferase
VRSVTAETWHYGLIADYWAEFNDDFRPHEIPYFRRYVQRGGGAALDVGCGTGRVLIPCLRAGLDVDGCDVSTDMVERCRAKAEAEALATTLWSQPMHELDPPRKYRTIYVCGAFGLGSTREQDAEALRRFREALEPGGTLLVDTEMPYADPKAWPLWLAENHGSLPEEGREPRDRSRASDGSEYGLAVRIVELNPLEQRLTYEMCAKRWRDGEPDEEETRRVTINLYFRNELELILERAGFSDVEVQGDHNDVPATPEDDFLVFLARR